MLFYHRTLKKIACLARLHLLYLLDLYPFGLESAEVPANANMIQAESAAVSEYREPTQAEEMKKCK